MEGLAEGVARGGAAIRVQNQAGLGSFYLAVVLLYYPGHLNARRSITDQIIIGKANEVTFIHYSLEVPDQSWVH